VEYLDQRFPSKGQRLLPDDPLQRFRVCKVAAITVLIRLGGEGM
jgi:glutathione S-transferase